MPPQLNLVIEIEFADATTALWSENAGAHPAGATLSTDFEIQNVRVLASQVVLDSALVESFNHVLLSGRSLVFSYPTVHTQQSTVPPGVAEHNVTVARAFTKLRSRGFNSYSKERRSPGWGLKDPSRSRGFNSYSKERRSPGWGLKDPSRSRGFNSYSKERRSPGWGLKDPSWTMIYSYSKERRSPGWGREDPSAILGSRKKKIEPAVSKLRSCRASSN